MSNTNKPIHDAYLLFIPFTMGIESALMLDLGLHNLGMVWAGSAVAIFILILIKFMDYDYNKNYK